MEATRKQPDDRASEPGAVCKVTAIVRLSMLERVEDRLQDLQVPGISVTKVKGYGEYANFFRPDWMVEHARIEIFLHSARADEVARAIADAARTGGSGDGLVAVLPVEVATGDPDPGSCFGRGRVELPRRVGKLVVTAIGGV